MSQLHALSDGDLSVKLFDRARNRPAPDPNRPRPVVDAFKAMLTSFITTMGPELLPLLLQLLKGSLAGAVKPSSVGDGEPSDLELVEELARRRSVLAHNVNIAADNGLLAVIEQFIVDAIRKIGPEAIDWLIAAIHKLITGDTAA